MLKNKVGAAVTGGCKLQQADPNSLVAAETSITIQKFHPNELVGVAGYEAILCWREVAPASLVCRMRSVYAPDGIAADGPGARLAQISPGDFSLRPG